MPTPHQLRKSTNERLAREKALHTHVYISGLSGHHTLETGIAYYYRGHYIYAYPAGTLIEPVPYSTRKGILIQGIVSGTAPGYDGEAAGLVAEGSVRALAASVEGESRKTAQVSVSVSASDDERLAAPYTSPSSPFACGSGDALKEYTRSLPPLPVETVRLPFPFASAPTSRLASRSASPSTLRQTSSHIGLARLSVRTSSRQRLARSFYESPDGAGAGAGAPADSDSDGEEGEDNVSWGWEVEKGRFESNKVDSNKVESTKRETVGYLHGLGDHALSSEALHHLDLVGAGDALMSGDGECTGRNSTTTGRTKPCAIHGESCDGVATEWMWTSEEMRRGKGFVEDVPMVESRGRVMVDWVGLLEEEVRREGVV